MQDDLFSAPADLQQHDGRVLLVSNGREYRSLETEKGIGVAWFGPGNTQGVVGCYYPSNADALSAAQYIESKRTTP